MRSEQELNRVIDLYSDMVKRLCMVHLKNEADMEDIFQIVFLKYYKSNLSFEDESHEKAWFIRVTINACKDLLKNFFRRKTIPLEDYISQVHHEDTKEYRFILEAVLALPEKYKNVIYLYYYEGYSVEEISQILKKKVNTVYTLLSQGRHLLKEKIGDEDHG